MAQQLSASRCVSALDSLHRIYQKLDFLSFSLSGDLSNLGTDRQAGLILIVQDIQREVNHSTLYLSDRTLREPEVAGEVRP